MAYPLLRTLLTSRRSPSPSTGFTLIELLIVLFIAGGIISGLMYFAVELLTTDRRESVRTETQRDLQLAMDYMSGELREAIYVYPDVIDPATNQPRAFLPIDNGAPVLAFWKQQRLPREVRETCASTGRPECLQGHSYSLVVYSLGLPAPGDNEPWQGRAQIIRSAMTQYNVDDGDANPGFITPTTTSSVAFETWPPTGSSTPVFNQVNVLTDFIDDGAGETGQVRSGICPEPSVLPGVDPSYGVSPSQPINGTIRSFYACVSRPGTNADGEVINPEAWSQEVILYLQGNADGRSGIYGDNGFLPTLETRVLSRGILDKNLQ